MCDFLFASCGRMNTAVEAGRSAKSAPNARVNGMFCMKLFCFSDVDNAVAMDESRDGQIEFPSSLVEARNPKSQKLTPDCHTFASPWIRSLWAVGCHCEEASAPKQHGQTHLPTENAAPAESRRCQLESPIYHVLHHCTLHKSMPSPRLVGTPATAPHPVTKHDDPSTSKREANRDEGRVSSLHQHYKSMNAAFVADRHRNRFRLKQDNIKTGDAGWYVPAMLMLRAELRRHA